MKRVIRYTIVVFIFLFVSFIGYLRINPPLAHGSVGTTEDKQSVIVAVGNKNLLGNIEITDISINGNGSPSNVKIQVSDSEKGFIITDVYSLFEKEYGMRDYESVIIGPNTSPSTANGVVSAANQSPKTIYGLSINEETPIQRIEVTYRYLGLAFVETIHI